MLPESVSGWALCGAGMEAAGFGGRDRDGRIKLIFTALISNLSKGMQLNRNNLKQEYSAFP